MSNPTNLVYQPLKDQRFSGFSEIVFTSTPNSSLFTFLGLGLLEILARTKTYKVFSEGILQFFNQKLTECQQFVDSEEFKENFEAIESLIELIQNPDYSRVQVTDWLHSHYMSTSEEAVPSRLTFVMKKVICSVMTSSAMKSEIESDTELKKNTALSILNQFSSNFRVIIKVFSESSPAKFYPPKNCETAPAIYLLELPRSEFRLLRSKVLLEFDNSEAEINLNHDPFILKCMNNENSYDLPVPDSNSSMNSGNSINTVSTGNHGNSSGSLPGMNNDFPSGVPIEGPRLPSNPSGGNYPLPQGPASNLGPFQAKLDISKIPSNPANQGNFSKPIQNFNLSSSSAPQVMNVPQVPKFPQGENFLTGQRLPPGQNLQNTSNLPQIPRPDFQNFPKPSECFFSPVKNNENSSQFPKVPENPPVLPKFSENYSQFPKVPENPQILPKVPDNSSQFPKIPENPPILPKVPENPSQFPKIPENPPVLPKVPENTSQFPKIPENPPVLPKFPDNSSQFPKIPENPPILPKFSENPSPFPNLAKSIENPQNELKMPVLPDPSKTSQFYSTVPSIPSIPPVVPSILPVVPSVPPSSQHLFPGQIVGSSALIPNLPQVKQNPLNPSPFPSPVLINPIKQSVDLNENQSKVIPSNSIQTGSGFPVLSNNPSGIKEEPKSSNSELKPFPQFVPPSSIFNPSPNFFPKLNPNEPSNRVQPGNINNDLPVLSAHSALPSFQVPKSSEVNDHSKLPAPELPKMQMPGPPQVPVFSSSPSGLLMNKQVLNPVENPNNEEKIQKKLEIPGRAYGTPANVQNPPNKPPPPMAPLCPPVVNRSIPQFADANKVPQQAIPIAQKVENPPRPEVNRLPDQDRNFYEETITLLSRHILENNSKSPELLQGLSQICSRFNYIKNIQGINELLTSRPAPVGKKCGKCNNMKDDEDFNIVICEKQANCRICSKCRVVDIKAGCPGCRRLYSDYEEGILEITKMSLIS
jgi:hypothetical protein